MIALAVAIALVSVLPIQAAEDVDFARDVRPILAENCFHCHGPDAEARQAELRLDVREAVFGEREGPALIVPGKSAQGELMRRVTSDDQFERMPPADSNRALTPGQIETLRRWVEQGAKWQEHWSLQPPERPVLPEVERASWPINAVDRFILARLEQQGLQPSAAAQKHTLIRRVTLDLTGLPPTPEEVAAFLADDSPSAYEKVVDRLLASPRYGERMVWPWLDAARYADSNGYQGDPERTMWPWRDWVVEAMNDNIPFDRFTIEQMAGDLLPEPTLDQVVATGFHRNHMYNGEGGRIPEETRVENVMDRAETTATVWLGMTMTCARCHDHKYDPVTQRDYYRLYAFFNNTSEQGRARSGQIAPVVTWISDEQRDRLEQLKEKILRLQAEIRRHESELFSAAANASSGKPQAAPLPTGALREVLKQPISQRSTKSIEQLSAHYQKIREGYAQQLAEFKTLREQQQAIETGGPRVMVMDQLSKPRDTFVLVRGAYDKPAGKVAAGVPRCLPPLPQDEPANRLTLARWLVADDHPLTARVTVNRYWQLFFGAGLVRTPEDFGTQGKPPTHPLLLDWLAREFVESGWNVKHMHRLLVTSAAYRQSARVTPEQLEKDPENRWVGRGVRYRLPSWMLRDQALFASGLLVPRIGGAPVRPYQPQGVWAEATFGKKRYVQDHGDKLYRRSLYTFWRRIVGPTLFFDVSSRQTCSVKTYRTNTPLHALVTLNDVTYVEAARALAARALRESGDDISAGIGAAFLRLTARSPRPAELALLQNRYQQLKAEFAADPNAAEVLLSTGESPRGTGVDQASHAALSSVCLLLLNLDETLTRQ